MNKIDIVKGLIFKQLHVKKTDFSERLICQKKIYLLQELGTDLGYMYNWYVKGPYSPVLTNDIYENLDFFLDEDFDGYNLAQPVRERVNIINSLEDEKPMKMETDSWYELLASYLYIWNNRKSWGITSNQKEDVAEALVKDKPIFDHQQCNVAYGILLKNGFIQEKGCNG